MTEVRHQRRVPRQPAGWRARCRLSDEPGIGWEDCNVLDISVIGVGVEVFATLAPDLVGRRVTVDVEAPVGGSVSLHMVGEVRNVSAGASGGTRLGMAFVELSETEQAILAALEAMGITW